MKIDGEQLDGDIYRIGLSGRMDLPGSELIETEFTRMTGPPRKMILVDLSGVNFVTSYGIRMILYSAKGIHRRGGKMVLINPDPGVARILETAGIETLIPIRPDLTAALDELGKAADADDEDC